MVFCKKNNKLAKHKMEGASPIEEKEGEIWNHTAIDAESRLILSVVCDKRSSDACDKVVEEVKKRTGGRTDLLLTSDEHSPYKSAIEKSYAVEVSEPRKPGPGRPKKPKKTMPPDLCYATVHKNRSDGKVMSIVQKIIFGIMFLLGFLLSRSTSSQTVNTSFVERNNGTDRGQNSRKRRKTYGFSKDWDIHQSMTYYIILSYNFCWPVRTLREKDETGKYRGKKTPAMAAGLTNHVWTTEQWITYPVRAG
jgi:hypothetical protein